MGDLLGGGGTESKVTSSLSWNQKQAEKKLGSYLTPKVGTGLPKYSGILSAELPEEYQTTQNYLQDVISGKYSSSDYLEPYFKSNIQDPLMKTWKETILPEIGGTAGKGGFFYGSGREELERRSAEDLLTELGKERSSLYFQTEQAERDRQQGAAGLSLNAAMGETAVEQGILTREQEEWMRTQPEYNHLLSMILGYLGGDYTTVTQESEGPGLINSAITGFATGFGSSLGDVEPHGELIWFGDGFGYKLSNGFIYRI